MIQKLQRKFIIVSMLSTLLVLTVIISAINILNYKKIVGDADFILHILSENNGRFPKMEFAPDQKTPAPPRTEHPFSEHISPELPYESRYFSVILDKNANILSIDTGQIAAIDTNTASQYALEVWETGKTSGFWADYRYLRQDTRDRICLTFLDQGRSLSTFRSFLLSSILVSILGLASVLFLVLIFSKIVMRPVSESYEKQRQFITDAGHEIKTPLTIIDANAEIIEMEYGENEWLQGIRKQTLRLASLTNDLIYLSRMEEQKNQLQKINFSLSDLIEETVLSFQALADTQKKSFSLNITPLLSLFGDEAAIRQLVSILLDNALKYSKEHSQITVNLQKKGKTIQFSVCNETESISKEHLSKLFERFYRTDASRNSETGGYGIGLSIAKAIVYAHKGKISASSEHEHSLTITVTFYTREPNDLPTVSHYFKKKSKPFGK